MRPDESLLGAIRAAMPDRGRTFLHLPDDATITYGEMLAQSGRFAHALAASGVRPGGRVAVQVEKSANALFLYIACLRAGAVYLPLNPTYTLAELEFFLSDAEPVAVVVSPEKEPAVRELVRDRATIFTLSVSGNDGSLIALAEGQSANFIDAKRTAEDLAAILYTSGTTGRSKGAMLTQDNLRSNALALRDLWRFTQDDVLLHALPIFHTHGLFTATNTLLMAGGSMIFLPRFELGGRREARSPDDSAYARFHFGIGAAPRRNAPRMVCPHRPRHSRTLRHDRDGHDRLQSVRGGTYRGCGRISLAQGRTANHRCGFACGASPG
jgi:malonyl-CoA/methylmalonyl-CoA synthetase